MTKIFIDWIYTNNSDPVYNPEILIDYTNSYTFDMGDLLKESRAYNGQV